MQGLGRLGGLRRGLLGAAAAAVPVSVKQRQPEAATEKRRAPGQAGGASASPPRESFWGAQVPPVSPAVQGVAWLSLFALGHKGAQGWARAEMKTPEARAPFIGRCMLCRATPKDQLLPFQGEASFPQSSVSLCLKSLSSTAAWEHSLLHPDLTLPPGAQAGCRSQLACIPLGHLASWTLLSPGPYKEPFCTLPCFPNSASQA